MIDYFALALTHGLLAIAFWRLMQRDVLDSEASSAAGGGDAAPSGPPPAPVRSQDRFKLPPRRTPRA